MTQEKLGALLEYTQPQISNIELGKDTDSLSKLRLIAEALDTHYLYFLEGDNINEYLTKKTLQKENAYSWKQPPTKRGEDL